MGQSYPKQGYNGGTPDFCSVANPAAGANFQFRGGGTNADTEGKAQHKSFTITYQLIGVSFRLTTDATVANRFAGLSFIKDDASVQFGAVYTSLAQVATTVSDHRFAYGLPSPYTVGISGTNNLHCPLPLILLNDWLAVDSSIGGLQATDQISNIRIYFLYWHSARALNR